MIITCAMIPMIESAANFDTNVMSLLDVENESGRHVHACCNGVISYSPIYLTDNQVVYNDCQLNL